LNNTYF